MGITSSSDPVVTEPQAFVFAPDGPVWFLGRVGRARYVLPPRPLVGLWDLYAALKADRALTCSELMPEASDGPRALRRRVQRATAYLRRVDSELADAIECNISNAGDLTARAKAGARLTTTLVTLAKD